MFFKIATIETKQLSITFESTKMGTDIRSESISRSDPVLELNQILGDLNSHLTHCLASLESLSPPLVELLHHETRLPNTEYVSKAAQAVDLMHKVQLLLDPPVLILADHFLGSILLLSPN